MSNQCPSCQRLLYSRRLKRCGYCGAEIPEELRFSAEEIAELDRQIAAIEAQRLERMRREAEEKEEQRRRGVEPGFDVSGFL